MNNNGKAPVAKVHIPKPDGDQAMAGGASIGAQGAQIGGVPELEDTVARVESAITRVRQRQMFERIGS